MEKKDYDNKVMKVLNEAVEIEIESALKRFGFFKNEYEMFGSLSIEDLESKDFLKVTEYWLNSLKNNIHNKCNLETSLTYLRDNYLKSAKELVQCVCIIDKYTHKTRYDLADKQIKCICFKSSNNDCDLYNFTADISHCVIPKYDFLIGKKILYYNITSKIYRSYKVKEYESKNEVLKVLYDEVEIIDMII